MGGVVLGQLGVFREAVPAATGALQARVDWAGGATSAVDWTDIELG